jgi:hypothetical protein
MARVFGFHACKRDFAEALVGGDIALADWKPSENRYDWLGKGIYFWERNKRRAKQWAAKNVKGRAAIIQAEIELGVCLDLADTEHVDLIRGVYDDLVATYSEQGLALPTNRSSRLRDLDRLVVDEFVRFIESGGAGEAMKLDTVCAPFEEGDPVFPGSLIRNQSHVQIAVRNYNAILAIELVE